MRFALRNDARTSHDECTPHQAPGGPRRRPGRLPRLAAAGLALFALAAAPMSHAASDGLPDAVTSTVSTTVATLASTALEATAPDAPHGFTAPEERAVRTAVAVPMTRAEQTSFTPAPEPDPEPAEDADQQEAPDEPSEQDDAPEQETATERSVWDRLADCESGEWVNGGESFIEGSARWDYGVAFTHEGYEQFQGGLNFHPGTWDAYRDPDMPDHAGHADRQQQIVVGERVLASQGWGAWPVCSEMIGLR